MDSTWNRFALDRGQLRCRRRSRPPETRRSQRTWRPLSSGRRPRAGRPRAGDREGLAGLSARELHGRARLGPPAVHSPVEPDSKQPARPSRDESLYASSSEPGTAAHHDQSRADRVGCEPDGSAGDACASSGVTCELHASPRTAVARSRPAFGASGSTPIPAAACG